MSSSAQTQYFILGRTHTGQVFRPSDWAERLAGVMAPFRPDAVVGARCLDYSPWCVPTISSGVKCVVVHSELRSFNPRAWDFVMNFARDNELEIVEACYLE